MKAEPIKTVTSLTIELELQECLWLDLMAYDARSPLMDKIATGIMVFTFTGREIEQLHDLARNYLGPSEESDDHRLFREHLFNATCTRGQAE